MKKVIRLTEGELTNLIKKIIQESEFDSSDDCERLFSTMEYVFNDFMDFVLQVTF